MNILNFKFGKHKNPDPTQTEPTPSQIESDLKMAEDVRNRIYIDPAFPTLAEYRKHAEETGFMKQDFPPDTKLSDIVIGTDKSFIGKAYEKPMFDGESFDKVQDQARLMSQLARVRAFLSDGQWHTLYDVHRVCGGSESGCSARIRDLKKDRFGGLIIEKRRQSAGVWLYRMVKR